MPPVKAGIKKRGLPMEMMKNEFPTNKIIINHT